MERLTKKEEPVMQIIWNLKKAFVNDIIELLPDPKPPYNTISSIVRLLEKKGMVGHESFGKTHRYFPKFSKQQYKKLLMTKVVKDYFDNSYSNLMSFIMEDQDLSEKEREELKKLADQNKKK